MILRQLTARAGPNRALAAAGLPAGQWGPAPLGCRAQHSLAVVTVLFSDLQVGS